MVQSFRADTPRRNVPTFLGSGPTLPCAEYLTDLTANLYEAVYTTTFGGESYCLYYGDVVSVFNLWRISDSL